MEEEKCENEEAEKSAAKFPGRKEGRYWLLSGAYFLVGEEIRSSMPKEEYLEEERMEKKKGEKENECSLARWKILFRSVISSPRTEIKDL